MKKLLIYAALVMFAGIKAPAQQENLFNDSILSSIYITLSPDSLKLLYDSVLSDHYYKAGFVFSDGQNTDTLDNIGFRLRGNTSRYAKKKSFKISFNEYVPGRKYGGVKKINLNGEHNDPTMIREKLFYDLWKKCGMKERRTSFTKVFINGRYYGLYTNLEEMDKEWLERVYPDKSGNLYKCTWPADLVFYGTDPQTYKNMVNGTVTGGRVYDLQTNQAADDYTHLVELISQLNQTPDDSFTVHINQVLNTGNFLKALALDVATGNWDDYGFNKNNYYLYDNPVNGKFDFITYDPDNTFGVDWFNIDWAVRNYKSWVNTSFALPMAQKLLKINFFFEQYRNFADTVNQTIILPDSVFPRIDHLKQLIQQAAESDLFRSLDYGYTIADFNDSFNKKIDSHTPYGLKPFFLKRHETLNSQLNPSSVYENPADGGLTLSPNPVSGPLHVLTDNQNHETLLVRILDLEGRQITKDVPFTGRDVTLNVHELDRGLYILQVMMPEGKPVIRMFVKQ